MSMKNKLKGVKKAIVTAALGAAAIGAPLKGSAAETTPEKEGISTSEMANVRQQQFEAAVRAGRPTAEIAKYVDFPATIPVTKDGQFDKEKAEELSEKLTPYVNALLKKGESISAVEAYKAYKESMGETDFSFEDFQRVQNLAEEATKKSIDEGMFTIIVSVPLLMAGLALASVQKRILKADLRVS